MMKPVSSALTMIVGAQLGVAMATVSSADIDSLVQQGYYVAMVAALTSWFCYAVYSYTLPPRHKHFKKYVHNRRFLNLIFIIIMFASLGVYFTAKILAPDQVESSIDPHRFLQSIWPIAVILSLYNLVAFIRVSRVPNPTISN